ncbi:MAG TPA: hypothetical protein PKD85_09965, partial [Saprospiraceae bacterium]|nr:hypothetical protein [Saprospiraceae bacterium]
MISIDKSYLDKASDTVPIFSKISVPLYWTALVLTIVSLMYHQVVKPQWAYEEIFKINGFTLIIWATVLFFSATVGQYALNYLKGFQYQKQFSLLSFGFTLSVMLLVMSNHVVLL